MVHQENMQDLNHLLNDNHKVAMSGGSKTVIPDHSTYRRWHAVPQGDGTTDICVGLWVAHNTRFLQIRFMGEC